MQYDIDALSCGASRRSNVWLGSCRESFRGTGGKRGAPRIALRHVSLAVRRAHGRLALPLACRPRRALWDTAEVCADAAHVFALCAWRSACALCVRMSAVAGSRCLRCASPRLRDSCRRFFVSGPERAAARRRRLQLAKRAVARRVAQWRSRVIDGERQARSLTPRAGVCGRRRWAASTVGPVGRRYLGQAVGRMGALCGGPPGAGRARIGGQVQQ